MDKIEWMKALKQGDEVAILSSRRGSSYSITTVKNVTPTGKVRTENGNYLFEPSGSCKVDSYTYIQLLPVTQDIINHIERKKLLHSIKEIDSQSLTNQQMKEILRIVGTN